MAYKLNKMHVLVVDDSQPIRFLIRSLLLDLGIGQVSQANSGEEGWTAYLEQKPDMIMLDWRMADLDGLGLTRRIRTHPSSHTPHIPIIMTTGYSNKQRVFQARDAGVTEFLIKPFTAISVARHIENVIENPRKFVMAPKYMGPDRRRRSVDINDDEKKREADKGKPQTKVFDRVKTK